MSFICANSVYYVDNSISCLNQSLLGFILKDYENCLKFKVRFSVWTVLASSCWLVGQIWITLDCKVSSSCPAWVSSETLCSPSFIAITLLLWISFISEEKIFLILLGNSVLVLTMIASLLVHGILGSKRVSN